ncbi:MAG: ATP-binding protein [Treponema sp.]|nr:ATP-binding protein [Treponema sp.]
MIKWNLNGKIIFPSVIILFLLVVMITVYSSFIYNRFTTLLNQRNINFVESNLKGDLERYEHNSRAAAVSVTRFKEVIEAVRERDREKIIEVLIPMVDLFDITYFTVADENGFTLARTYEPLHYGDPIFGVQNIKDAMNGIVSTYYESGPVINISVHTGAPVYDTDGTLIGVISAGVRLDENESVDKLKERFNAEFSVFLGRTRIATTIIIDGERITSTQMDEDFYRNFNKYGTNHFDSYSLMGRYYHAFLHPFTDANNEIFAMMIIGISNEEQIRERNHLTIYNALVGLSCLVLAVFALMNIITKITKPVNKLVELVSGVTQGNLNVDIDRIQSVDDEIGLLSYDIYMLIDVVKSMVDDLSHLTKELNASGDIKFQIDSDKYSGSYKEIIEGINALCNSISMKNKTMAVMDYLDTMICVTDFDYNILYLNQKIIDTYKIDRENIIKQKCFKAIRNADNPCEHCKLPELADNKETYVSTEYTYNYDEYIGKWLGRRSAVIPWIDGSRVLCNYSKDESKVIDYEEQLRSAVDKAQAASISKSVFLANMSHEIRTPMNSIMGFSELAMDDVIPVRTKEYLGKILENTKGLLQIINDILDISKVESGKMEIEEIPFDLHELLASCRSLVLPKAVEKGITLYFYAEPSIGKIPLSDPTRLRQVIVNLLSNAVKFTNTGTIKVLAEIKEKTENVVTMYFEVKDSGIGMTDAQIEKIFDPFMQGESGTTRKYGGTGLGLTITKSIIELMGGMLSVESSPETGSRFYFTLAFKTIDATGDDLYKQKLAYNEYDKPIFDGEVLLCEDNAMNQQVICEHLARVGLRTVVAWNGKIGLDFVRERKLKGEKQFDLIFMDMHMPVMDGREASLKILELNLNIPIIAITANVMSDDREMYKENGLSDCVGKPFTSQELWSCLLKYLVPVSMGEKSENDEHSMEKNNFSEKAETFQKSLQSLFVRSNQNKFKEITDALEKDDIKHAYRLVHGLKSNAGQIGKTILQKAAAEVERRLKDGERNVTEDQLKILETELKIVLIELSPLIGPSAGEEISGYKQNSGQEEIMDTESVVKLVNTLEALLKTGNPECLKMLGGIRCLPADENIKIKLMQQIEDFEFEKALSDFAVLKDEINKNI